MDDFRLALRSLRRDPGFFLTAVLALALGVGANAAVFSVVEAVLLRPLPFPEADRLMTVWETHGARGLTHVNPSPGNFMDWERENGHFAEMALWYVGRGTLRAREGAEVVQTAKVTPGFFETVGARAVAGRFFRRGELDGAVYNMAEMNQGGDRMLVLSAGFWRRRFGGDRAIVGRTLSLDGADWQVAGVASEELSLVSGPADLYVPWDVAGSYARLPAGTPRDFRFANVVARLADGVSRQDAEARLQTLSHTLAERHPKENRGWSVRLVPLADELRGAVRTPILILFGATCSVLLVACLNVAGLQTARAATRTRELAVRSALGASRSRLFRHTLAEGLLIALAGSAAGLAVAYGGLKLLLSLQPWELPAARGIGLNGVVLAAALACAVLTALVFGAAPLLAVRFDPSAVLARGGRGTSPGRDRQRLRRALVTLQIAGSLVLLTGAGLFLRSFTRARAVRPGFEPSGLLVLRISLDKATYMSGTRAAVFYETLMARLAALPGVESAGGVTALPMSKVGPDFARPYWREGEPDPGGEAARAAIRMATPRYFEAMRMSLLRGRAFTGADRLGAPSVIVVNETLARRAFGEADPVGKRLVIDYRGGAYPYEIVGLVADARHSGLKGELLPELFIPHLQNPYLDLNVALRTRGEPASFAAAARRVVKELDPSQPVHSVVTMERLVGESVATDRFLVALFALLAGVALVLAATGIHGLLAYLVERRSHELGVRQALGAGRGDVIRLVLRESVRLAAAGAALGVVLSLFLGRLASGLLFQVKPADPVTLGAVAGLLATVVLLASALPARAAARVEPAVAMRGE